MLFPSGVEERQILVEDESSAVSKCDYEIHYDEYQIVVPARILFAPKARMPDEYLLLDCAEHDENQSHGSKLGEDSKGDAGASRKSAAAGRHHRAFGSGRRGQHGVMGE